MNSAASFPALVEAFFTDRLMRQRQASPHTIASYRDTFRLLLQYAQQQLHKAPSDLAMPEIDTPLLGAFLDHLEQQRHNSARSRNRGWIRRSQCIRHARSRLRVDRV